ncbi:uncharacterized protein LOC114291688 [Camellia sinensis]|uniref:uncharacterized protein LOC114291688 n=1 Tax=Camellia sinensis TaxID=4442 RepID=UPI0010360BEC|nr:uncharacterized protein LOC114291688 [Camellia sinensis]
MNSLSHTGFSDLLTLLGDMLPLNNEMPSSMYEAGKMFAALGMGYEKIHVHMIAYSIERSTKIQLHVLHVVSKDVPISKIAKNLTWHAHERDYDGTMCHPTDSPSWKLVDHKWPDFAAEPRNLRLAISADGTNPHSSLSSRYSCWPVIMITYNLPPWLCMKRLDFVAEPRNLRLAIFADGINPHSSLSSRYSYWPVIMITYNLSPWLCMKRKFMMLSLLISGPQQPGNDIDVYLAPLIDDLKMLWEGYYACPICSEGTCSHRLKYGKKNTYVGHIKFLPRYHPYRRQKKAFNGEQGFELAPIPLTGEEILNKVEGLVTIWGKKNKKALHVGGKTKDGINSRIDLVEMGLREKLAPQIGEKRTYLSPACYTLSKEEKRRVCTTLLELKVPEGYSSNLGSRVSMQDLKLYGLKSHDYHVLMQQLLPVAIRSVLPKHVRHSIIRLCFFFNATCSKAVDVVKLDEIQKELVVTLCLLEKYLPPSFFDIMVHLTAHLVREVRLCGPVHFRWMYQFERFMKILKGYVRNRNCPEGCIAESYIVEEAVEFCAEYLSGVDAIGILSNRNMTVDDDIEIGRPLSSGCVVTVDRNEWEQTHRYVLENTSDIQPYIEEHMAWLKLKYHRQSQSQKWLQIEHNKTFMYWLREKVSKELSSQNNISNNLKWIAQGPRLDVIKFPGYIINGCRYHTKDQDNSRVSQNSGVSLVATTMHVTGYKDKNPVFTDMSYYGVIIEIWQLDYNMFKISVFKYDWVDNTKGIRVDELGFTLVELGRIGHKDDPFILASQAKQVFYIQDQLDPRWSVVLEPPQKQHSCEKDDEFNDFCIEHHGFTKVLPEVESLDVVDDSMSSYMRGDCEGTWLDNP